MNCRGCGVPASYDSVDQIDGYDAGTPPRVVVDNGVACQCEAFECRDCLAKAKALDPEFDDTMCSDCNALALQQGVAFGAGVLRDVVMASVLP